MYPSPQMNSRECSRGGRHAARWFLMKPPAHYERHAPSKCKVLCITPCCSSPVIANPLPYSVRAHLDGKPAQCDEICSTLSFLSCWAVIIGCHDLGEVCQAERHRANAQEKGWAGLVSLPKQQRCHCAPVRSLISACACV